MFIRPFVRRPIGRGGLLGAAARTAVVAGTATAVVGGVQRRQQQRAMQAEQADAYEDQQQQAAMRATADQAVAQQASPRAGDVTVGELERLAALRQQGVLTDEEFTAAKSRLLGI